MDSLSLKPVKSRMAGSVVFGFLFFISFQSHAGGANAFAPPVQQMSAKVLMHEISVSDYDGCILVDTTAQTCLMGGADLKEFWRVLIGPKRRVMINSLLGRARQAYHMIATHYELAVSEGLAQNDNVAELLSTQESSYKTALQHSLEEQCRLLYNGISQSVSPRSGDCVPVFYATDSMIATKYLESESYRLKHITTVKEDLQSGITILYPADNLPFEISKQLGRVRKSEKFPVLTEFSMGYAVVGDTLRMQLPVPLYDELLPELMGEALMQTVGEKDLRNYYLKIQNNLSVTDTFVVRCWKKYEYVACEDERDSICIVSHGDHVDVSSADLPTWARKQIQWANRAPGKKVVMIPKYGKLCIEFLGTTRSEYVPTYEAVKERILADSAEAIIDYYVDLSRELRKKIVLSGEYYKRTFGSGPLPSEKEVLEAINSNELDTANALRNRCYSGKNGCEEEDLSTIMADLKRYQKETNGEGIQKARKALREVEGPLPSRMDVLAQVLRSRRRYQELLQGYSKYDVADQWVTFINELGFVNDRSQTRPVTKERMKTGNGK